MHLKKTFVVAILFSVVVVFLQCSKNHLPLPVVPEITVLPQLPAAPFNYIDAYPKFIQDSLAVNDNTPADNGITNDGATLGRVLFYDKHLSKNNTTSCASCHKAETAFSDNAIFSKGFMGGLTTRNSMALLNLRFYKSGKMFWDERAPTLEKLILQPIQNSVELGLTLGELETKVKGLSYYPDLFQKAFGSTQIDSVKIAKAVSQFLRSIVTFKSKYDMVKQGLATFTPDEAAGEQLFLTPPAGAPAGAFFCAGCHTPPMFLTSSPIAPFTHIDANDHGINNENRFKAGSLRNIALTAPYFHNGDMPTLNSLLNSFPVHNVPAPDAAKLLAFLQTLTDNSVTTDPRFSDPFK
ncbi:cytochrome-c peroxidase [Ferruginibacter sp. SUN106]|uniref:cytochrome-c peroxidase n=1 Tax=Ferruginibacter sp. SUN106 TaxID=2978348 RepID=UPI003D35EF03